MAEDEDEDEDDTGNASLDIRCGDEGRIWFDLYLEGVLAHSIGFTTEVAMGLSDKLMGELEKAVAIQTAQAGPFGHA